MSEHDLRRLLALVESQLGTSWVDISEYLRSINGLDAIEQRLRAGDFYGVVQGIEDAAKKFATETHASFVTAGRAGSEWLDSALPDKLVRFEAMNPRAVYAAQRNELELVHGLTLETRQTIQQVIVQGQRAGTNPREMARDIRDSITLTPQQAGAVRSYRQALESGDFGNALSRELSSGHSDRTIRRVARDGGGLSAEQIDTMTERYRQNALTSRAETIARTESAKNVHAGLDESMRQAVDRGDVRADQLVKEWIHAGRGHSRPAHAALDGKQVKFGETFDVDGVQMQYPHDPTAPVEQVANCRCTFSTTLDSL
jgi:uncharacterized protein with gpF-like domain